MYKKKIILLTGNELRHIFFRKALALNENLNVICSFCEDTTLSLENRIRENENIEEKEIMLSHVNQRKSSEIDFFSSFIQLAPDKSYPIVIKKGDINNCEIVNKILSLNPDYIIVYGSSIIKSDLIDLYANNNKIINLHLGLSPYYRGSGTNFWPLVDKKPECVGATFMFLDSGIDTGNILHQIRPKIYSNDTPHSIGNRLITEAVLFYPNIIQNIEKIKPSKFIVREEKLCKRSEFSANAVKQLYYNFSKFMIKEYLENKKDRDEKYPLISMYEKGI